jgi:methyl-accepting chemotaxis protein
MKHTDLTHIARKRDMSEWSTKENKEFIVSLANMIDDLDKENEALAGDCKKLNESVKNISGNVVDKMAFIEKLHDKINLLESTVAKLSV